MVLRGSAISPETTLQDAEENLKVASQRLIEARSAYQAVQKQVFEGFSESKPKDLSKAELVALVDALQTRLDSAERASKIAEVRREKASTAFFATLQQLGVGGAAGAIARTTVAPLDRVKILMQTSHLTGNEGANKSISQSLRNIIKNEGVAKLWRGNFTNCIRVIPHTATQFVAYDKYKKFLVKDNEEMTVPTRLLAGALSGMTAATVTHPMDVVRIRLQTQSELKGIRGSIRSIYQENGLRTFYKGYTPAMLSLSPFIAINFATMDVLKKLYFGGEDRHMTKKQLQQRNPMSTLFLGACSGIIAQTCCYPLDTVRRRMQMKGRAYSGTLNAFATILKDEGMRGFYKGMSANALKVVPNNAIRFAAFDFLKTFIMKDQERKLTRLRTKEKTLMKQ